MYINETSRNLTEQEIIEAIIKFNNDPKVQVLQCFYHNQSVPEILSVSRREVSHSAFLSWIFNPNANHGLGQKPLIQLLELYLKSYRSQGKEFVANAQKLPESIFSAILTRELCIISTDVKTEKSVTTNKTSGRADIVITCDVHIPDSDITRLSIIIENKVYSRENKKQTQTYFDYHELNRLCNKDGKCIEFCLYIYLTPSIADKGAECAYFVHLTYQNLLDHIFERLLALSDINERTKFILTEYVNNLSLPSDYVDEKNNTKKGKTIMAIGKRERELLQSFWDKHKTLFTAALTAMSTDENSSEEERQDFKKMLESVQSLEEGKKYYRYQVNGEGKYPCGQVVVKIIEMYVSMNSSISLDEINSKFEKFHKPFAVPLQNAITINETPNKKGRCIKRYFTEYPITLVDNNQIAITSQWGNDKNFENLIEFTKSIIPKLDVQRVK